MEIGSEEARIVHQMRKHVSAALAVEINLFFRRGGTFDDLHDVLVRAAEERRKPVEDMLAAR